MNKPKQNGGLRVKLRQLMQWNNQHEDWMANNHILYFHNRQKVDYFNKHNATAITKGRGILREIDDQFFVRQNEGYVIGPDGNYVFIEGKTLNEYRQAVEDSEPLNQMVDVKML